MEEKIEELLEKINGVLENITPESVAKLSDEELEELEEILEKLDE